MKICANCGTQVPDDAVFCNNCGSALTENAAPQAPANGSNAANPTPAPAPAPVPTPVPGPAPQQNFQNGNFQQQGYQQQPGFQPQQAYQYQKYDPSDHTANFDAKDIADNKLFAVLPYIFSCLAGILAGIYVHDSEYIKFHTKVAAQYDIILTVLVLLSLIPFVGWVCGPICIGIVSICRIISLIYALQGKAKDAPIIGSIGFLKF